MMTLAEAVKTGRLQEFIAEQEAAAVGPIDRAEFDGAVAKIIKATRLEDQTSRSASGGNLSGKKIRRDSGQGASD